jgi:uncharacterized protein (DUF433 family)
MTLPIHAEPVPLHPALDGTVRVGGTRVLLETVVAAFREGASAEQIVERYPDLDLADAYAVIGYYLHNRAAVDAYVASRRQEAERLRGEIEAELDPQGIRDRLLARRARGK